MLRKLSAGLVAVVVAGLFIAEAGSAADVAGHYCKEQLNMIENVWVGQHGFSLPGAGAGLPYTCGTHGCHQIPDWVDGACENHGHVAF